MTLITPLARLNRPWMHFVLLGCALFYLQQMLFPAAKPAVGPLGEARLDALQRAWMGRTGRPPSAEQLARLVSAELDRDILFQRAIALDLHRKDPVVRQTLLRAMGFLQLTEGKTDPEIVAAALDMRLHLSDELVRRRLVSVMEAIVLAANPPAAISEADLNAELENRRGELRRPPRYSIEHVYFTPEQAGAEVEAAIQTISAGELTPREARGLGSLFLTGYRFARQTPDQLARHFGTEFVNNLQQANPQPGAWSGPISSTYGSHYVWVSEVEPPRDPELDEVRRQLRRDLEHRAKAAALQAGIARLRNDYEVRL